MPVTATAAVGTEPDQLDPVSSLRTALIVERVNGLEILNWPPDMLYQNFGRGITDFPSIYSASLAVRHFCGQDQFEVTEYLDDMQEFIDILPALGRRNVV